MGWVRGYLGQAKEAAHVQQMNARNAWEGGASVAGVAGWLLAQPVAQRGLELRSLTFEGHRSTMLSDLE